MSSLYNCPHCQQRLRVGDGLTGSSVKCPGCRQPFQIPADDKIPENHSTLDFRSEEMPDEPWYYGYISTYATIIKWIAIAGVCIHLLLCLVGSIQAFVTATKEKSGAMIAFVFAADIAALMLDALFLFFVFLGIAWVYLMVDAARNIRHIRYKK